MLRIWGLFIRVVLNADSPKRGDETLVALSARNSHCAVSRIKYYVTDTLQSQKEIVNSFSATLANSGLRKSFSKESHLLC